MEWKIETSINSAQGHHDAAFPEEVGPTARFNSLTRNAIVLGSSQDQEILDSLIIQENNVELANRKTGGGLVYIDHLSDLWVDVFIPKSSGLFIENIDASFEWLGNVWIRALQMAEAPFEMNISREKPAAPNTIDGAICFASKGHGEVMVNASKLVGISQRRNRQWAKYQCLYSPGTSINSANKFLNNPVEIASSNDATLEPVGIGSVKSKFKIALTELDDQTRN